MGVFTLNHWKSLHRLLPSLLKRRWRLFLGFCCIVLTAVFAMATPYLMGRAVDALYVSITSERLIGYAVGIILLTLFAGLFRFGSRWLIIGVSREIEYELRADV